MYQKSSSYRGPSRSSGSSFSRPSRRPMGGGFNRGPRPGGFRRGGNTGQYIDPSKFINKSIITEEVEVFTPEHTFQDFVIVPELKQAITVKGYSLPTPIQDRAIPYVLKGVDVVGIANTGTGKTAAFLIPLINKVLLDRTTQIMVVVPTRELAIQIEQELKDLAKGMKIFSVCCVGGASIGFQISELRYNNNFIIGTPGRLKDLIDRRKIVLGKFGTIVLDEADRMLDMGFIADMRFLMAGMRPDRQTLFFSATLSKEIEALIGQFLKEPVRISVKTRDTSKNVEQDIVRIGRDKDKLEVLHELLGAEDFNKVLIFGRTKHGVERLSKVLTQRGFKADSIHGDKSHSQRQRALQLFKGDNLQILVATDVAARGLDISDVSHVINYDIPATYEDYVHRIGRTGRGNKRGKALTFIE